MAPPPVVSAAITETSKHSWVLQCDLSFYAAEENGGQDVKCALSVGETDTLIAAHLSDSFTSAGAE